MDIMYQIFDILGADVNLQDNYVKIPVKVYCNTSIKDPYVFIMYQYMYISDKRPLSSVAYEYMILILTYAYNYE